MVWVAGRDDLEDAVGEETTAPTREPQQKKGRDAHKGRPNQTNR